MPEFHCPGPITVDVRVAAGQVEIHAEPRDTAVVEVSPYRDSDGARELAAATRVELTGDTLVIAAPESSNWLRRSPRLRVTARVPAGSTGRLRGASVAMLVSGEWAAAKVNTASGDTTVERVTGDLTINTASGDVRAEQVGGRFTVRTASGDVSAGRIGGPVDITSASGNVHLADAAGDVRLKTASGDATVDTVRGGAVRATAVSGDVSIGVPAGTGVWLDLHTVAGRTHSDLAMGGSPGAGEPTQQLTVQARTVSGNIDVHRMALPAPA